MAGNWKTIVMSGAVALAAGFGGAALYGTAGFGEEATRTYLIENPEILQQMAEALQRQEARQRLAQVGDDALEPFPGAVLGNPDGSKTLVEFSDYNCGFCRVSREHVDALVAADPDLRVVIRELPIFEGSEEPARMALAAAKQGRFPEFHKALFEQDSRDAAAITRAASIAGLDMERAMADAVGDDISVELAKNQAVAQTLGFAGTPSWIAGGTPLEGAVGVERLAELIAAGADKTGA